MVKYTYDTWGIPSKVLGLDLDPTRIEEATLLKIYNPFLYKGYYYDKETNLYYCNSRYYNPEWGRWLNADDIRYIDPKSISGLNLYVYCDNNPVMNFDPDGNFFISVIIFGALLGGGLGAIKAAQNNDNILTGFLFGAIIGGIGAAILPAASTGLGAFAVGFGFGFGTDVLEQMIVGGKSFGDVNLIDSLKSGVISGTFNVFSLGIKNNILNPLNKKGDILGEIMSDIIYSTNFELGSFTTDQIINGFGLNKNFTVNDLRNKIFPKSIYSTSRLPFNY